MHFLLRKCMFSLRQCMYWKYDKCLHTICLPLKSSLRIVFIGVLLALTLSAESEMFSWCRHANLECISSGAKVQLLRWFRKSWAFQLLPNWKCCAATGRCEGRCQSITLCIDTNISSYVCVLIQYHSLQFHVTSLLPTQRCFKGVSMHIQIRSEIEHLDMDQIHHRLSKRTITRGASSEWGRSSAISPAAIKSTIIDVCVCGSFLFWSPSCTSLLEIGSVLEIDQSFRTFCVGRRKSKAERMNSYSSIFL